MFVKSIGFIVSVVLSAYVGYQLAWHSKELFENPLQSLGLFALAVVAVAFLIWGMVNPAHWKILVAFALGVVAAVWGNELLDGIGWKEVSAIIGGFFVLVVLWAITVLGIFSGGFAATLQRFRSGDNNSQY